MIEIHPTAVRFSRWQLALDAWFVSLSGSLGGNVWIYGAKPCTVVPGFKQAEGGLAEKGIPILPHGFWFIVKMCVWYFSESTW
jgi:hypothetical protein